MIGKAKQLNYTEKTKGTSRGCLRKGLRGRLRVRKREKDRNLKGLLIKLFTVLCVIESPWAISANSLQLSLHGLLMLQGKMEC